MNDPQKLRSVWRMASRPLIAAVLMCAAAAALAGGTRWWVKTIALEQSQAQADLLADEQALQNAQTDRARLEENLQMFDQLKQSGFAQASDRLGLLEALESAARDLQQSALAWELGPQENLKTLKDDKTGVAVAQLVRVAMKLSLDGIHEEEWLSLLARLQGSGAGYFTTDSCVYKQGTFIGAKTTVPALQAVCHLSWLYIVATSAIVGANRVSDGAATKPP